MTRAPQADPLSVGQGTHHSSIDRVLDELRGDAKDAGIGIGLNRAAKRLRAWADHSRWKAGANLVRSMAEMLETRADAE